MKNRLLFTLLISMCYLFVGAQTQDTSDIWTKIRDLKYIYSMYPNNPPKHNVVLMVENATFKNDTLKFRLNLYNNGNDTLCLLMPYLGYYIESSLFIIYLHDEKTGDKIRFSEPDENGIINSSQISSIGVFVPLEDLVSLPPHNGFYQDYAIKWKLFSETKYAIQLILDYEYTIKSLIPLTNLVQQVLESNILDVTYK